MKIVYIHYHLKTGGVTTVLKQQVEALRRDAELLVLTGEPLKDPFPAEVIYVPGLGYDHTYPESLTYEETAKAVLSAIYSKWDKGCDLLHVHNPILAKNKNFLKTLKYLQFENIKLFLQIHDFAEDGRPLSYFREEYVSDCHYGVINSRDYRILIKAGLKTEGLHKIFNMIKPLNFSHIGELPQVHILYPIRAIRRKNIGEAILLSLFFKDQMPLVITLPPNSPIDIRSYESWKKFAKEKKLNVVFDAGLTNEFETLVMASKFFITTSITEGFGFSFLEPWLAKKILWGRKLPDICDDFEKKDIRLRHLYNLLLVPLGWIDHKRLLNRMIASVLKNYNRFKIDIEEDTLVSIFQQIFQSDNIDFSLLDEEFQKRVIDHILSSDQAVKRMIRLNPFLHDPAELEERDVLIENNYHAVLSNYNQEIYRKNLLDIYYKVSNNDVSHRIDKRALLTEFFDLKFYSLLKWSEYVE